MTVHYFAPHIVIALPTFLWQKLLLLIYLPHFMYSFFTLVHGFFSVWLRIYTYIYVGIVISTFAIAIVEKAITTERKEAKC